MSSVKDFVLEIGTEPLPARFVAPALEQLLDKTRAALDEARLGYAGARSLGTFRRLAVCVCGVEQKSSALAREVQGPPARLLKDASGRFTPQAEGFARKQGVSPEELETVATAKGEFLLARVCVPGESALKILARVMPQVIASLEFPKSLEWEATRFRFGRPIRTLTAIYGKAVVPFTLAGVRSGKTVPVLSAGGRRPVTLASGLEYCDKLRDHLVYADPEERRQVLVKRLEAAAKQAGGRLDLEGGLLEETVFMTEHPVPVVGHFQDRFLRLPAPLLKMVLKKQLKFFPVLGARGLAPFFVGVRDGASENQAQVREGYERVLTARLSDAAFFLERDQKTKLESKRLLLGRVTYQNRLGSLEDKSVRVTFLAEWMCSQLRRLDFPLNETSTSDIAALAYADLVCETVKEFPELQGLMGGHYARHDGLDERVALGLEEFYFPLTARSPIPTTLEGAVASLAGKLDSLAGNFAVGNAPTGSADPFALRRQAAGALRIVLEKQMPLDMEAAVNAALTQLRQRLELSPEAQGKVVAQVRDFIWGRAQTLFEEQGYRSDEIRSVREGGLRHLPNAFLRLAAVHAVRRDPEFEHLAAVFKRAANILKQAAQKGEPAPASGPERASLREAAELELFDAIERVDGQVAEHLAAGRYEEGLREVVTLKPKLDAFFEKVMVMAEDASLRRQRLALLSRLVLLIERMADLSEIQGGSGLDI
ncbi:MAG TPA: glycine--tRNA ligase subunit beta [Elusimicrobia bacterium]|nr:glycine--tRNA ligase subunit beta [Elusimicrobiota bacterium]HBT62270.1 glycine--tRNA ligase subunit beta [Elusimicrobiota bacterium]